MFSDVYFQCWRATRWARQTEWCKEITNTKSTSGSHQCQLKPESVKGTSCISFIIQYILNKVIIEAGLKIQINTNVSIEAYTLPSASQCGIIDTFWKEQNHLGDAVGKQNYHLTGTPRIVIQAGTHLAHSLSFCVRFCKKTLAVLDVQLNIQNMQRQGCAQCCNIKPANIDLTLSWHRVPSDTNTWLWGHLVPSSFHCMLEKCSYLESSQLIGKARWVLGWRAGRGRPPGTSCARDTFPASSGPKQMEREVKWPLCG